jgi:hypothetical protein
MKGWILGGMLGQVLYREYFLKGRFSTVDLHVPNSKDQLLFISKLYVPFYKTNCLNEEVNRTVPSL